jgi:uncharacterized protein
MSPIDEKPSRNEDEYFTRVNAEQIKSLRAQLDTARQEAERASHRMRCPRCGAQLEEREHAGIKIDVCPECGGTWLDKGELEILAHVEQSEVRRYINTLFGLKR